jgi:hypothetical protein
LYILNLDARIAKAVKKVEKLAPEKTAAITNTCSSGKKFFNPLAKTSNCC